MPPSGLIISKLGIQATASDDSVKGLLCLKISLPRESEGRPGARWALFNSSPPKLLKLATIHPLPLPLPASRAEPLKTAAKLLSLPAPTSYPPSPHAGLGGKPYIDVSSTTGKVFVVLDPVSAGRRGRASSIHASGSVAGTSENKEGRRDWLVCLEFEIGLEQGLEEGINKVLLPLPKCLDNVIRFQILSPGSLPNGEVNILTEPKMLPLPASAFAAAPPGRRRLSNTTSSPHTDKGKARVTAVGQEEGWEDGEDLGPDDEAVHEVDGEENPGSDDEDSNSEGSWLEGRFQSTELLRLEWSYNALSSSSDLPFLQVVPKWDKQASSISLSYHASVSHRSDNPVQLEVDVPEGWAWTSLSIAGNELRSWRSLEGDLYGSAGIHSDPDETLDGDEADDSFATIRGKRSRGSTLPPRMSVNVQAGPSTSPTRATGSSASLMRQTLPATIDMKMEDYSFEMSSMEQSPMRATTPGSSKRGSPSAVLLGSSSPTQPKLMATPTYGRTFHLFYDDGIEKDVTLQGSLVPLAPSLLVSPSVPVQLPFISLENGSAQCQVQCPAARLGHATQLSGDVELADIGQGGSFLWADEGGHALPARTDPIRGDTVVSMQRSVWGVVTCQVMVSLQRRAPETSLRLTAYPGSDIRVVRSTIDGALAPHATFQEDDLIHVVVGKQDDRPRGPVKIELEISPAAQGDISLPLFEGDGTAKLQLVGDGWDSILPRKLDPILQTTSQAKCWTYPHSSHPKLRLSPSSSLAKSTQGRMRTLLSWSTLLKLLMLWLLVSMGQQVQRLRSEVAFVVDETRDLRMYGLHKVVTKDHVEALPATVAGQDDRQSTAVHVVRTEASSALGPSDPQIARDTDAELFVVTKTPRDSSLAAKHESYPLGRVVHEFGKGWERWMMHPTVQSITKSVAWMWEAVVWLIAP
ncbi:hypothetical protein IAU60_006392 [Kwoniella sp. DSM 27419]